MLYWHAMIVIPCSSTYHVNIIRSDLSIRWWPYESHNAINGEKYCGGHGTVAAGTSGCVSACKWDVNG